MAGERQCASRSTIKPNKTCSADLYRCIKRRVRRSFKQTHCKKNLVHSRKQAAYKLSGTQNSLSSLKRVLRPLFRQDSSCSNQQHHSIVIHKQGRKHEVGPTLCPTVENLNLVYQKTSDSQSPAHSRLAECGRRRAIQASPDHPDRVVPPSIGFQVICSRWHQPQIDLFATRFNKLPLFLSPVPDPLASVVEALSLPWEVLDEITLSHQQPSWAKW